MKKIIISLLAALAFTACTNLDEHIYSKIAKENFFTSQDQLVQYSARAYSSLQHWGTEKSLWTFVIQNTNEVCVPVNPHGGWWDDGRYNEVHVHKISTSNPLLINAWDYWTKGVTACNDVLDTFQNIDKDFEAKDRMIAEIKVLRAYFYMCGIDNWEYVPFSIDKKMNGYPEKKDGAYVWDFIVKEITDNIDKLQVDPTPDYYGRITRGAANAILAKLYLNSERWTKKTYWEEAEAACKDIIMTGEGLHGGKYTLADKYKDNFEVHNENCPEQIFAIPFSTVYTQSDHNAFVIFMSTLPANLCGPLGINAKAWDGLCGEPDFLASYDPADTRKKDTWLYGQVYDKDGNPVLYESVEKDDKQENGVPYIIDPDMPESVFGKENRRGALQGARIWKWTYQSDGKLTGDNVGMDNDFFLIRYADVILMYVEALVRQGKVDEAAAVPEFQQIRTRAGLAPMTAAELTLDNLYWERAHELAIEGWQREDMIRFGKYLEAWWCKPEKTESDYYLPLPKTATAANPNLQ